MQVVIEETGVTKEALEERLKHLPNKEEFYSQMDEIMTELKAIREEHIVSAHHISNHEDRLQVVEKRLKISPI